MLKYRGGGFVPGVPARDLSDAEAAAFGGAAALVASGLYERIREPRDDKKLTPARETVTVETPGAGEPGAAGSAQKGDE